MNSRPDNPATAAGSAPEPPSPHAAAVGAPAGAERCPLMPSYGPPQVMFVRGSGARLWDRSDREYLDFLSGLAVTSLGHSHPRVAEALAAQAQRLLHVSNLFATEHNGAVAQTLDRLLGGGGQVFFCNSGAEANEAAIKLARRWAGWGRYTVISTLRSFHGRTLATLHATGQPEKHEVFQPLPEGFRHVPFADVTAVEKAVDETTAAVLVEPVQGEGGVNVPSPDYLPALRALCDERGLLLMFDEVQTGLARTGRWFAPPAQRRLARRGHDGQGAGQRRAHRGLLGAGGRGRRLPPGRPRHYVRRPAPGHRRGASGPRHHDRDRRPGLRHRGR